jgi:hypothetical protein
VHRLKNWLVKSFVGAIMVGWYSAPDLLSAIRTLRSSPGETSGLPVIQQQLGTKTSM